jgi:hypothetical protein
MPKFSLETRKITYYTVVIEADSIEAAEAQVAEWVSDDFEEFENSGTEWIDAEWEQVEEVGA